MASPRVMKRPGAFSPQSTFGRTCPSTNSADFSIHSFCLASEPRPDGPLTEVLSMLRPAHGHTELTKSMSPPARICLRLSVVAAVLPVSSRNMGTLGQCRCRCASLAAKAA